MSKVFRYILLCGIIVFLGTWYLLDNNLTKQNVSRAMKKDLPYKHYFKYTRTVSDVNCNAIFQGDIGEIKRAENITLQNITTLRSFLQPQNYLAMTKNCSHFKRQRGYIDHHLTEVERDFPIAFSLLMFIDIEQSERLLRAIYRPQNLYCIHVDSKTDQPIYDAMSSIASCFDNVFMTSKRFDVQWGTMTVLEPDLLGMQELWNKNTMWKYFINLTGQEFPLRTNYELVRILQAYNGSNDIEGTFKRANRDRWQRAGAPPHNITAVKGAVHVVVNRGFVDFILHDQRARDLLNWARHTEVPDETFFATLNHNPHLGVPGAFFSETYIRRRRETDYAVTSSAPSDSVYLHLTTCSKKHGWGYLGLLRSQLRFNLHAELSFHALTYNICHHKKILPDSLCSSYGYNTRVPETDDVFKPFVARFKDWDSGNKRECHGKYVHHICVIGTGDLPELAQSKNLIVNKFHQNFHPHGYDCLEELIANRTRDIYLGDLAFDSRYYETLGFVENKI